ncbi:phosphoglycerate dehydrogenase [Subtercola boreus]|uniref:Phosphoglycerate dehydrogenase n=1 Tax=Subtercola boreus TaxID=120213 RepID=A0A3E0VGD7_9MICO|nr:NAD(P)-dependent oxidoreductase [Subtercola boreus]RFA08972.1 phosphoglycerate dehydrogenase [Subtercola boreus]TQL54036.1 phosphoglycerate dehydrogenase-like enzyme [Subtercola boreus]
MKILLPNTIPLDDLIVEAGDEAVRYDVTAPIPHDLRDADVFVAWQNTPDNLASAARELGALRLVQTLAAGPDAVLAAGFRPDVAVTSGRSLHDATVAEHTLALTLALVRRLDRLRDAQRDSHWDDEFLAAQQNPLTAPLYTLAGASVCIWGFGSIARTLAPMFELMGATVTGVASSAGTRFGYDVVDDAGLPAHLAGVDVLVSLLPATPASTGAFDKALIDALKPGAVFVNVGRGATVDEPALIDALRAGRLRAAALDVMVTEPLPADSPLWTAPNLLLTPHAAGNRPRGAAALIARNLQALRTGGPLTNLVGA